MRFRSLLLFSASILTASCTHAPDAPRSPSAETSSATPLVLTHAESFTLDSTILKERRRINVLLPTVYGEPVPGPVPVLYMPDGGLDEDFLHIAGLVRVLVSNGTMRPVILVGIENTQRRRDMTSPTENPEDRAIAPVVGGSAAFRTFLRDELMPVVRRRYATTSEASIVGESLAGLFVLETLFEDPSLFQNYIAIDPSVWWNNNDLIRAAASTTAPDTLRDRSVMVLTSNEPSMAHITADFISAMQRYTAGTCNFVHQPLSAESHATIYHPAALIAFRTVLAPPPKPGAETK